jgi:hypothetical protein
MKIKCDKCGKFLKVQGALVFAPPIKFPIDVDGSTSQVAVKWHICVGCWDELRLWILN